MSDPRVRFQVWLEPKPAREIERWAQAQGKSLSASVAHLAIRGLVQEGGNSLDLLTRVCDALSQQVEQLQAVIESLESREAERFRLFLGHLQQHQAITTELLHLQRLMFMDERASAYAKVIESAREQVAEDAKVFRSSLASGGAARRVLAAKGPGKAA
jgi:hypothetical protein